MTPLFSAIYTMIVGLAFMIAELSPDTLPTLVSNAGVLGVLIWYLYYTTTKTLPDITKRHYEQMNTLTTIHTTNIENVSAEFARSLIEERKDRKIEIESLKHWMSKEICASKDRCPVPPHHPEDTKE